MNVRPTSKSIPTLESVALTDIVMNLFIFFFISFSLLYTFNPNRESKIDVKLPSATANSEAQGREKEPLVVSVTQGGEIFIGKSRVLPEFLKKELMKRYRESLYSGILVRSDKSASVDALVKVLDASKQAGIQKLGVAIQNRPDGA